ncbi:hypothetical protein SDJN03_25808, partial [Cucurbita argyrosperma subsp. sororia]
MAPAGLDCVERRGDRGTIGGRLMQSEKCGDDGSKHEGRGEEGERVRGVVRHRARFRRNLQRHIRRRFGRRVILYAFQVNSRHYLRAACGRSS